MKLLQFAKRSEVSESLFQQRSIDISDTLFSAFWITPLGFFLLTWQSLFS